MISQRYGGRTNSKATMPSPVFRRRVTMSTGSPFDCFDEGNEGSIIMNSISAAQETQNTLLSNSACKSSRTDPFVDHGKGLEPEGVRTRKCTRDCDIDLQVEVEGLLCEQDKIAEYLASAILRMSKVLAKMADQDKGDRMCQAVQMMVKSHQSISEKIARTVRDGVDPSQEGDVEPKTDQQDHKRRSSFLSITSQPEQPCKRFHFLETESEDRNI